MIKKILRWFANLLIWLSFIGAIFFLFLSLILFLSSEKEEGFVLFVLGVVAMIPYALRKRREKGSLWTRAKSFNYKLFGGEKSSSAEEEMHTCLNCGNTFQGNYCPNCGQDKRTEKIDWHQLMVVMLGEAINFDGTSIRTFRELIRQPGQMLHNYLTGQHERYTNPMKFVLFAGVLFAIMSFIFPSEVSTDFVSNGNDIHRIYAKFAENIIIFQCILALLIDFFPLYGAFKWTEEGKKISKVDFYIIVLYLIGMDFWLRAIMCPLTHWSFNVNIVRWYIFFGYQFYVLKDFFKLRFFPMVGRYILRDILNYITVIISLLPFMALDAMASEAGTFPIFMHALTTVTGSVVAPIMLG